MSRRRGVFNHECARIFTAYGRKEPKTNRRWTADKRRLRKQPRMDTNRRNGRFLFDVQCRAGFGYLRQHERPSDSGTGETLCCKLSQVGRQRDLMPDLNLRQSAFICGWSSVDSRPFAVYLVFISGSSQNCNTKCFLLTGHPWQKPGA